MVGILVLQRGSKTEICAVGIRQFGHEAIVRQFDEALARVGEQDVLAHRGRYERQPEVDRGARIRMTDFADAREQQHAQAVM